MMWGDVRKGWATWARSRFRGVGWAEPGDVGSSKGMVNRSLNCSGSGALRELGVLFSGRRSLPEWV
jgi:hypothetical protein